MTRGYHVRQYSCIENAIIIWKEPYLNSLLVFKGLLLVYQVTYNPKVMDRGKEILIPSHIYFLHLYFPGLKPKATAQTRIGCSVCCPGFPTISSPTSAPPQCLL